MPSALPEATICTVIWCATPTAPVAVLQTWPVSSFLKMSGTNVSAIVDKADGFVGDGPMVNVCIATRKNDTALRDKLQKAMDELGWNDKAKMDALMEKSITQQPAAN